MAVWQYILDKKLTKCLLLQDCDIFYTDIATSIRKSEEMLTQYKSVPSQVELTDAINNLKVILTLSIWFRAVI